MTRTNVALLLAGICISPAPAAAQSTSSGSAPAAAEDAYPPIPSIPAIGVRNTKYLDVRAASEGPAVDPAKGYRLQDLGAGCT